MKSKTWPPQPVELAPREFPHEHDDRVAWLEYLANRTGAVDIGLFCTRSGVWMLRVELADGRVFFNRADMWHLVGETINTVPFPETKQ